MDDFWVYTSVRNEEHLMPFFLRHYAGYADKIFVQDCGSTDRTKQIVKQSGATLVETQPWGMDEGRRRDESMQFVRQCAGATRWCACVDADEFLVGDFDRAFAEAEALNCGVLQTIGYSMVAPGFPKDDGRQIYEICRLGSRGGAEKPAIVKPGTEFLWGLGRHFVDSPGTRVALSRIFLLHYRYLGKEYTALRNFRNYTNSPNKATAWACAPEYNGDTSPAGVQRSLEKGGFTDVGPLIVESLNWDTPLRGWLDLNQPGYFVR